jgi:sialic acid synthase SpsE
MDDLISTKATLKVLYRVLERANTDSSEYQNTFEQFVMWHLSSFDYSRLDKIQGYEANAWKIIYNDTKWIDIK